MSVNEIRKLLKLLFKKWHFTMRVIYILLCRNLPALRLSPDFCRVLLMHRDSIISAGITIQHKERKSCSGLYTRAHTKLALWKSNWSSIKIVSAVWFVFSRAQLEKCKEKITEIKVIFCCFQTVLQSGMSVDQWRFKGPQPDFDWWPHAGEFARSNFLPHMAGLKSDHTDFVHWSTRWE